MCKGISPGVGLPSIAEVPPHSLGNKGPVSNRGGGEELDGQAGNPGGRATEGSICKPAIYCAKEGWFSPTSGKPQTSKQLHREETLQDGRGSFTKEPGATRRLDGIHRFERCLPVSRGSRGTQEVPEVPVGTPAVRVSLSPLWPQQCPTHLHETAQASDVINKTARNQVDSFSGRYVIDGKIQGGASEAGARDCTASTATGLCGQLRKVSTQPNTENSVSGVRDRLSQDEDQPTNGEGGKDQWALQQRSISIRDLTRLIGRLTTWSAQAWYPALLELLISDPLLLPKRRDLLTDPFNISAISRLESVRRQHNDMGVSERSSELIMAGWSTGTNMAYQSAWKRWCSWCAERKIDPLSCGVQPFLDFLADLFEQGLQHRTINLIHSAISMTHQQVEGISIGQHPLVTRLIRGVHNSIQALSKKLALLMALTDASRTSELQALDLRFRRFRPVGVYFTLAALTKKRKVRAPAMELFFGAFPQDHTLCVVQCLRQYEKVTKDIRSKDRSEANPLFLSYIKPHRPITSQRIAHWIKDLLGGSTFKAHSVRGASTTAALAKGVSLQDILHTADWSAEFTFQRFYYRPEKENVYACTLLNLEDKESGSKLAAK